MRTNPRSAKGNMKRRKRAKKKPGRRKAKQKDLDELLPNLNEEIIKAPAYKGKTAKHKARPDKKGKIKKYAAGKKEKRINKKETGINAAEEEYNRWLWGLRKKEIEKLKKIRKLEKKDRIKEKQKERARKEKERQKQKNIEKRKRAEEAGKREKEKKRKKKKEEKLKSRLEKAAEHAKRKRDRAKARDTLLKKIRQKLSLERRPDNKVQGRQQAEKHGSFIGRQRGKQAKEPKAEMTKDERKWLLDNRTRERERQRKKEQLEERDRERARDKEKKEKEKKGELKRWEKKKEQKLKHDLKRVEAEDKKRKVMLNLSREEWIALHDNERKKQLERERKAKEEEMRELQTLADAALENELQEELQAIPEKRRKLVPVPKMPRFMQKIFSKAPIKIEIDLENKVDKHAGYADKELARIYKQLNSEEKDESSRHKKQVLMERMLAQKESREIRDELKSLSNFIANAKLEKWEREQLKKDRAMLHQLFEKLKREKEQIESADKKAREEIQKAILSTKHETGEAIKSDLHKTYTKNVEKAFDIMADSREALLRLDTDKARKHYIKSMRLYKKLSPGEQHTVYSELADLYNERKATEARILQSRQQAAVRKGKSLRAPLAAKKNAKRPVHKEKKGRPKIAEFFRNLIGILSSKFFRSRPKKMDEVNVNNAKEAEDTKKNIAFNLGKIYLPIAVVGLSIVTTIILFLFISLKSADMQPQTFVDMFSPGMILLFFITPLIIAGLVLSALALFSKNVRVILIYAWKKSTARHRLSVISLLLGTFIIVSIVMMFLIYFLELEKMALFNLGTKDGLILFFMLAFGIIFISAAVFLGQYWLAYRYKQHIYFLHNEGEYDYAESSPAPDEAETGISWQKKPEAGAQHAKEEKRQEIPMLKAEHKAKMLANKRKISKKGFKLKKELSLHKKESYDELDAVLEAIAEARDEIGEAEFEKAKRKMIYIRKLYPKLSPRDKQTLYAIIREINEQIRRADEIFG
ncbi:hypothetical protein GF323_00375 [Candidatus Woesearchaeota archaeon]|nr:hypothetical protein [Candidatus Woesearchaeota archaeon]